ncbi:MAG: hypothetical protein AAF456_10390 [Planctomycetota bacterium]
MKLAAFANQPPQQLVHYNLNSWIGWNSAAGFIPPIDKDMMQDQIENLMRQASELDNYELKLPLLREAVRLADVAQLEDEGFEARMELISAANFSGHAEESLVAFHWCLSRWKEDQEIYHSYSVVWKFKWIAGSLKDFPEISRQQILQMEDELGECLQEMGYNLRQLYKLQFGNRQELGEPSELIQEYFDKWQQSPRDVMSDCPVCDDGAAVLHFVKQGQDEKAVELVEEMLDGWQTCENYPLFSYGNVLLPLVELGRNQLAQNYHQASYGKIAGRMNFMTAIADHICYLVRIDDLPKAMSVLEKNFSMLLDSKIPDDRLEFLKAATFLMTALGKRKHPVRKIRFPDRFDGISRDHRYDTRVLARRFEGEMTEIAQRFDQRNGNDYVSAGIIRSRGRVLKHLL